jgi:hypothetical protein
MNRFLIFICLIASPIATIQAQHKADVGSRCEFSNGSFELSEGLLLKTNPSGDIQWAKQISAGTQHITASSTSAVYGISGQKVYKLDGFGNLVWCLNFSVKPVPSNPEPTSLSGIALSGSKLFIQIYQGPYFSLSPCAYNGGVLILDTNGVLLTLKMDYVLNVGPVFHPDCYPVSSVIPNQRAYLAVKAEMQQIAGNKYKVLDRFEQQEDTFKIMSIEKMIAYIFLTFILVVACFNIIGSLSMLIIDKKNDVVTLRNLGANDKQITRVFLFEGRMIAVIGAVIGIGLGLLLCFLQQQYGFVRLGDSEGSFIVDAYPVSVHYSDVAIIFVTVIAVGWLAVWYPVRALSKRLLS